MPNARLKQPMLTLVVDIFISLQLEDIRSFLNRILEREMKRELHCGGKVSVFDKYSIDLPAGYL